MQRKPHTGILLAVVIAALASGAACDKLRARDKLNKGVQAYKGGQFDRRHRGFQGGQGTRSQPDERAALSRHRLRQPVHSRRAFARQHSQRPAGD